MDRRPSIKDIAAAAHVSTGTVSNVLNRPDRVRPDARRAVELAIAALGYVPDEDARRLRAKRLSSQSGEDDSADKDGRAELSCELGLEALDIDIVRGLAAGGTSASLAVELGVSTATVDRRIDRLMRSLNATTTPHLTAIAVRTGLA